jgi:acetyl-CoA synthetase
MAEESEAAREGLPFDTRFSPGVQRWQDIHRESLSDPNGFWGEVASRLYFSEKRGPVFAPVPDPPFGRWFAEWKTNLCYNCVDRWLDTDRRHQVAFHWEGEPGDRRSITYR